MRKSLQDFLFSKGYFVGSGDEKRAPEALAALAKLFNIRIVTNPGWASIDMVSIASRNLGKNVPKPFYRGFPESVKALSFDQIVLDQLIHYTRTYHFGDFSTPGYSLFEEEVIRKSLNEDAGIREFSIVDAKEADAILEDAVESLLASTRPLNDVHYGVVRAYIEDYGYEITACACKDTAVRLLLDTRDVSYARLLKLSDVIRLVEQLQFMNYYSLTITKLNLRNRDRVLLTRVLDRIFEEGVCDVRTCLEKKKLWKGLLHHLHYKAQNEKAKGFLEAIRNNEARSAYSAFERAIAEGRVLDARDVLLNEKGAGAVLRQLDYLLSRCENDDQVDDIVDGIITDNKILLIQLLMHYRKAQSDALRVFRFQKFGMLRIHEETVKEAATRRTGLDERVVSRVRQRLQSALEGACKGMLGKVYVDEGMRRTALPLQEGTSMGGVDTLPSGSRLVIPDGKKIRAFTYWERVDDIDLSAFAFDDSGKQIEFSWRTPLIDGESINDEAIVFSGDQTAGYHGGSEFFDVSFARFGETYPGMHYLVFCNNVYSNKLFSHCLCKAGYMMRDEADSGEVFEPKTVKSSFAITSPTTFAYLFAIDLETREIVWLNIARDSSEHVAGATSMAFLADYLESCAVINLFDFAHMLATEVVDDPLQADVVFSDKDEPMREDAELIRSVDIERVIELLNRRG